ncbi:hypothetical protein FIBSPDRAFT_925111 [Athelia psychrophila]|uniref:Uncharacterized protein n=1 Tax=Athelia psychrophila TaxID=1759441 RepID=A0A166VE79_9AGAM|nr:hypothetical protein FIBSPDRAFT_925111 [Fibularhizoctonia sp. CBS 109695]
MNDFAFWESILAGPITSMGADGLPNVVYFGTACIKYTQDVLRSIAHFGEVEVEILVNVAIQDTLFFNNILLPALQVVNLGYDFCVEVFRAIDARRSEIRPRDPPLTIIMHGRNTTSLSSVDETLENSTVDDDPQYRRKRLFDGFFVLFLRELRDLWEQFDLLEPALHPKPSSGARPLNVNIGNVEESLGCRCRTCEKLVDFLKSSERLELHAFGDSLSLNHVHLRVQLGGSQSHIKANLASGSSRQKLVIVKQQHPDDLVVQENRRRRKPRQICVFAIDTDPVDRISLHSQPAADSKFHHLCILSTWALMAQWQYLPRSTSFVPGLQTGQVSRRYLLQRSYRNVWRILCGPYILHMGHTKRRTRKQDHRCQGGWKQALGPRDLRPLLTGNFYCSWYFIACPLLVDWGSLPPPSILVGLAKTVVAVPVRWSGSNELPISAIQVQSTALLRREFEHDPRVCNLGQAKAKTPVYAGTYKNFPKRSMSVANRDFALV